MLKNIKILLFILGGLLFAYLQSYINTEEISGTILFHYKNCQEFKGSEQTCTLYIKTDAGVNRNIVYNYCSWFGRFQSTGKVQKEIFNAVPGQHVKAFGRKRGNDTITMCASGYFTPLFLKLE